MLYYRPQNSVAADVIPYHDGQQFRLFYLRDFRNAEQMGEGVPWYGLTTQDFLQYADQGEMLPRGDAQSQDLFVFTGSVFQHAGRYYLFYTGHNPYKKQAGQPEQVILRAISTDGSHWEKDEAFAFQAPVGYEEHDWRDPFIFQHPETGEFGMLLAARLQSGPYERRGCTAVAYSSDLTQWRMSEQPLYAPNRFYTHECPDLFYENGWWYLIFSEFSERSTTRYVYSRSLQGPWQIPANDSLDNTVFYAAKSASDGQKRYLFGWNRTRLGDTDLGRWQWGGHIVPHWLKQNPDGTLAVDAPPSFNQAFAAPEVRRPQARYGALAERAGEWLLGGADYALAMLGQVPETALLTLHFQTDEAVNECGLLLRADDPGEMGWRVRLYPANNRMGYDLWPVRQGPPVDPKDVECYARIAPQQEHELRVFQSGSVWEVYLDGAYAMSMRVYQKPGPNWGVYSLGGGLRVRQATVAEAKPR